MNKKNENDQKNIIHKNDEKKILEICNISKNI